MFSLRFWVGMLLCVSTTLVFAQGNDTPSFGQFAAGLMEPIGIINKFIHTAALILALLCFFSAFLRYMQYRINPVASPIGTVVVLVILGLALLALPFIYLLTGANPFQN